MVAWRRLTWKGLSTAAEPSSSVRADADAAFEAAAGHPHREAVAVVVAAGAAAVFGGGLAAEFAAPDDERFIEQAALLEVFQQGGDWLVGRAGMVRVIGDEVAVGVPVVVAVSAAGVELHEAHAALHEPAGEQAARAEVARFIAGRRRTFFWWLPFLALRSTASGASACILYESS